MVSMKEDDEYGDVNASVSREFSEIDTILSVQHAVSDKQRDERGDSDSSEVTGDVEREYDTPDSSIDHGSVSVECGSNAGSEDNHSTAVDGGGGNQEDVPEDKNQEVEDENQEEVPEEDVPEDEAAAAPTEPERIVVPDGLRKRAARDETPSEVERIQLGDAVKVRRTGILGKDGRPIPAANIKIPRNRREAMRSQYADLWRMAELEEMAALRAKGVLQEIEDTVMPSGAQAIRTMWVYAYKTDAQGFIIRIKARLVALGNWQRPGIDFVETFAPVARMSSFRLLLATSVELGLTVYGGDINTAYLNAKLEIEQYVRQIEGFPCESQGHVYVVKKALYGLRQSGREWSSEINGWLLERDFQRCSTEPCLYYKLDGERIVFVLVYVDDILCATNDEAFKVHFFHDLDAAYGLKDQGEVHEYLGVEVTQTGEAICISQRKYAREILGKYVHDDTKHCGNPMETNARLAPATKNDNIDSSFDYRGALGMLMYLATSTRPDLAYSLGQLSRFVAKPSSKHVGAIKRVLRYLIGTCDYGIKYTKRGRDESDRVITLSGFCDSDWGSDPETRKSTSGSVFTLAGGAVAWMSRRQPIIALSTAEAEYVAACEASMEAMAESNILTEILPSYTIKPIIGIDSSAALTMATNPTYSRRTRHIEFRWHYVREQVQRGSIALVKVRGEENPADAFTKPLDKTRLESLGALMGITTVA
ncbi:putative reverse transcriptase, RNA-dependent DNA polymerase [Plasmopara halstedii]